MDRKELTRKYKMTPRPAGVYRVHNSVNGMSLVGSSPNLPGMLNRQRFQLEHGSHPDLELQEDWNKCGPTAFTFEVHPEGAYFRLKKVDIHVFQKAPHQLERHIGCPQACCITDFVFTATSMFAPFLRTAPLFSGSREMSTVSGARSATVAASKKGGPFCADSGRSQLAPQRCSLSWPYSGSNVCAAESCARSSWALPMHAGPTPGHLNAMFWSFAVT